MTPIFAGDLALRKYYWEPKEKAEFTANFQKENLEREKAGLPPLDWCAEIYRARPRWYHWDGTCKVPDQLKVNANPMLPTMPPI